MVKVGIVGASGYGGGELLRLLAAHPDAQVTTAVSETYAGKPFSASFPNLTGLYAGQTFATFGDGSALKACDVVFLAQENGKAIHTAPPLLEAGVRVVDLSADFRLRDIGTYEAWYKVSHVAAEWNERAVYGLPELHGAAIAKARLVGNPGCYPTATLLALAPLLSHQLADTKTLIVDAKSGTSGAGRSKFAQDYHFPEMNESFSAYKIAGTHRHTPEIEQEMALLAGENFPITFTPHLVPITRGILATCYANLNERWNEADLFALYEKFYAEKPFVHIIRDGLPATKHTLGSNRCHIGLALDTRMNRVTVVSVIDNLGKGMAGQAIQNMNLLFGLDETTGLLTAGGLWP